MNAELIGMQVLSVGTSAVMILLGVALVVVGLVFVRRASPLAGACLAGAGGLGAFATLVRLVAGLTLTFGGSTAFAISHVFASGVSILASLLVPASIFLLASALKQGARPSA